MTTNKRNKRGTVKFLVTCAKESESLWGKLIAIHRTEGKAILISMNSPFNGLFSWGQLVLVEKETTEELPQFVCVVNAIPNTSDWKIMKR
jgi:hypothetical protein